MASTSSSTHVSGDAKRSMSSRKRKRRIEDHSSGIYCEKALTEDCKSSDKFRRAQPVTASNDDHRFSDKKSLEATVRKAVKDNKFRFGNYYRYYGRRPGREAVEDPRLEIMNKECFHGKVVLDIGCNAGHITLSVAKKFEPLHILGIDIDEHLIGVARKNIRHYCDRKIKSTFPSSFYSRSMSNRNFFDVPKFPMNVWFRCENYVLDSDEMLEMIKEDYDVIMALSVTKWIHLNWGDQGLKRFFKRVYKQLQAGGLFILEPQSFDSYRRRAKIMPEMKTNYMDITFRPEHFHHFLVNEIGFTFDQEWKVSVEKSEGFKRPIFLYKKAA